jgi:hypothetical protein
MSATEAPVEPAQVRPPRTRVSDPEDGDPLCGSEGVSKRQQITILLEARRATEETIRAFDTKAQIAGVGMILSVTALVTLGSRVLAVPPALPIWLGYLLCTFLLACVVLFACVLWPMRRIEVELGDHSKAVHRSFFVRPDETRTLAQYVRAIEETDWVEELAFEVMKLARLRDSKQRRFRRALLGAALFYATLLLILAAGLFYQAHLAS